MAIDQSFSEAFIHGPHRILGRSLRPFCAWHLLLLQALESPYVSTKDGQPPPLTEPHDLRTAIAICSLPFGESKTSRPSNPISWWSCRSKFGFSRSNDRFIEYLGDFLQKPEFAIHIKESDTTAPSRGQPPEVFQLVCDVISFTKWPEKIVWELPIGALYWYQVLALKEKYDVDIIDDQIKAEQEKLAELIAKRKAAKS